MNTCSIFVGESVLLRPRREFAPAWRLTFFAGAKKVSKETPNTSLFERRWLNHLTPLQRVVRSGATSIHGDVKGLFFRHRLPATTTVIPAKAGIQAVSENEVQGARRYIPWIPAFAGMTKRSTQLPREVMFRRDQPKTWPERQWLLAESRPHVCSPAPNHLSPHRLAFRCFFGDFLCTSKESYSAAGPNTRRGAPNVSDNKRRQAPPSRANKRSTDMDRMIYLSMAGAKATMQRQDTLANNLANVSTVGFRAELQAFRAVPVQGSGASTRVYALETTPGYDSSPGVITNTGRNLDVAAQGKSWFAVQALDGTEAYTRAGGFEVSSDGALVTRSGLPVMGDGGPIQIPPNSEVSFGLDGTVSSTVNGRSTAVGKLKLVTPEAALTRGEDGLFRAAEGDLTADATARIQSSALEGSNVSPVETMVAMIAAARQFETQMKMLQTAEANEKSSAQLLSMNG
jgi:flagellar basal-body rod protein FlgF